MMAATTQSASKREMYFAVLAKPKHIVIRLKRALEKEGADELVSLLENLDSSFDLNSNPALVIDLNGHFDIDLFFVQKIARFAVVLKKQGKQIYLLGASSKGVAVLKHQGMDHVIQPMVSLEEVCETLGISQPTADGPLRLDVAFINPFIHAFQAVMKVQCKTEAQVGKPYLKTKNEAMRADVASFVSFKGKQFSGFVCLGMQKSTFLEVMGRMLQKKFTDVNGAILDGSAELLNIITGTAKTALNNDTDHDIELSLPRIVSSESDLAAITNASHALVIPFKSDCGDAWLEIGFKI